MWRLWHRTLGLSPRNDGTGDVGHDVVVVDPGAGVVNDIIPLTLMSIHRCVHFPAALPQQAASFGWRYGILGKASTHGGTGRLVGIDPATRTIAQAVDIPEFSNCGARHERKYRR